MHWLWTIIIGLIVGAVAKLLMPGKDPGGAIAMEFNSEGMFRASRRAGEEPRIAIYRP